MKWITYEWLAEEKACPDQLAKFKEIYGDKVEFTRENAEASLGEFDVYWFAYKVLDRHGYNTFLDKAANHYYGLRAETDQGVDIDGDRFDKCRLGPKQNIAHRKWAIVWIWEYINREAVDRWDERSKGG